MKQLTISLFLLSNALTLFSQATFDQRTSVNAATAILATLSPAQKTIANLPFSDASRIKWSNLPMEQAVRFGIEMKDLADSQRVD